MKDDRVGNEKLLVAGSNKRCEEIYRRIQYIPENEK